MQGGWVYTSKQGNTAGKLQHKAHYVVKGFTQVHLIDYEQT